MVLSQPKKNETNTATLVMHVPPSPIPFCFLPLRHLDCVLFVPLLFVIVCL